MMSKKVDTGISGPVGLDEEPPACLPMTWFVARAYRAVAG
jgi:hypothetical protein